MSNPRWVDCFCKSLVLSWAAKSEYDNGITQTIICFRNLWFKCLYQKLNQPWISVSPTKILKQRHLSLKSISALLVANHSWGLFRGWILNKGSIPAGGVPRIRIYSGHHRILHTLKGHRDYLVGLKCQRNYYLYRLTPLSLPTGANSLRNLCYCIPRVVDSLSSFYVENWCFFQTFHKKLIRPYLVANDI